MTDSPEGPPGPLFDATLATLQAGGEPDATLETLRAHLDALRQGLSPEQWSRVVAEARAHRLCTVLHEDPFSLRCYSRPRGYPGDGVALDYVLTARTSGPVATARVARIHRFMTHGGFARALRFRREYFARMIDEAASAWPTPVRVFAAGAGHMRELGLARAIKTGRIDLCVAYDHDDQNLEAVRREFPDGPVRAHQGSLRQLVEGLDDFGDMHLVYCSGLLETLPQASAQGLVKTLFRMLRPGGRLVLSNFLPALPDAALLEIYFDWRMTLRTQGEIFALAAPLPKEHVGSWIYSENAESTIGFLAIDRREPFRDTRG